MALQTALVVAILSCSTTALAQETISEATPRGLHARGLFYGSALFAVAPETEVKQFKAVGGGALTTGFDIALHPNHDIGGRVFLSLMPPEGLHVILAVAYRFHGDLQVDEIAPFFELGVGGGYHSACWGTDNCGGIGASFAASGGGEFGLQRYVSLVAGAQVVVQTGLPEISVLIAPTLFFGVRAG